MEEKVFLLNEYITTVKTYLKGGFEVLLGIQVFFYNEDVKENKSKSSFYIEHV